MTCPTDGWGQWLGWTIAYVVAVWAAGAILALMEPRLDRGSGSRVGPAIGFVLPLALAFLIGARFGSWWWVLGPPVAILVTNLTYPLIAYASVPRSNRQNAGAGLGFAIIAAAIEAGLAALAAATGIVCAAVLLPHVPSGP